MWRSHTVKKKCLLLIAKFNDRFTLRPDVQHGVSIIWAPISPDSLGINS